MVKKILNSHKSIIFLNGIFPDTKVLDTLDFNLPILAADGAASQLKTLGITPSYIIGDRDSYSNIEDAPYIHIADQDTTDCEKCLLFAEEKNLSPALILGVSGGELDHTLGNMQAMLKHACRCESYFIDTYFKGTQCGIKLGFVLTQKAVELQLHSIGNKVSFVSFGDAFLNSSGLEVELHNTSTSVEGILAIRNTNREKTIRLQASKGSALVIIDITNCFEQVAYKRF